MKKKIRTVREFQIKLSQLNGDITSTVNTRHTEIDNDVTVEITTDSLEISPIPVEVNYRKMFTQAIANNCNEKTFDIVGMEILLDDDLFQRYVTFKQSEQSEELESAWILEAINVVLNKTKIEIKQPEVIMAQENPVPIPEITPEVPVEEKVSLVDTIRSELARVQTEQAVAIAQTTVTTTSSSSDEIDWSSIGKTVGVFALGAAVGAAGKWAWNHFTN